MRSAPAVSNSMEASWFRAATQKRSKVRASATVRISGQLRAGTPASGRN
ncbi:hypothetical protein [Herbidospora cretacea]|nr:hypothetical protein [Herbidospora cretacea]